MAVILIQTARISGSRNRNENATYNDMPLIIYKRKSSRDVFFFSFKLTTRNIETPDKQRPQKTFKK
jgi:hypothetical protein